VTVLRVGRRLRAGQVVQVAGDDGAHAAGGDDVGTHGAWSVVVMRLDGRPGVDVDASIGLRFGFLLPAGLAALTGGTALLALAPGARRRAA
jgi:hypothetical protein